MMRIEAIRDRTNERNQTHQAKSTRAVGSNAGSFGKSSRWRHLRNSYSIPWRLCRRRHTLPESTWLGSIIPAITDDMGGPNFGHASSSTPKHLLSVLQEPDVDLRRITDAIGRARQQVCHMGCS